MRKLGLLSVAGTLLVLGVQAQVASAVDPEPSCAGGLVGIQGFHYGTSPATANQPSSAYAGAALCGTDIGGGSTPTKYYKEGYIVTPGKNQTGAGLTMRCANPGRSPGHESFCGGSELEDGSYVGHSGSSMVACPLFTCWYAGDEIPSSIYVHDTPGWLSSRTNDHCNDPYVIQCIVAADNLNLGWMDVTVQPCSMVSMCNNALHDTSRTRYWIHLWPPEAAAGKVYLTQMGEPVTEHPGGPEPDTADYVFCQYAGAIDGDACGSDTNRWLQKNGKAGTYGCAAYQGEIAYVVTNPGFVLTTPQKLQCSPATWS